MRPLLAILLAGSTVGVAFADKLRLGTDARLSGIVRSINEQGAIELVSPLSDEPLRLQADAVEKVEFSTPAPTANFPETLVELANGDLLPVSIESLDDTQLKVTTADMGTFSIPRSALKSMQMGVHRAKVIYAGPKDLAEWTGGQDGDRNWRFADSGLVAGGPARASHAFDLPARFVLKFTLKWKANPNFQIFFADPLTPGGNPSDRYYLQFNSGGMEIKRESTQGKRYQSVILLPRTPDQFPTNEVDVEIRVDRKASRLHLFLNGVPEVQGLDPYPEKTQGGGISIVSISPSGSSQEIRDIEIEEYDNARTRHRSEDRGDLKTDSLISSDDDRWGGHLTEIRKTETGNVFSFKSDFQDAPLEIPESDVSTVFFAQSKDAPAVQQAHSFALRLRGEGLLRVSSCVFSENEVTAQHPLLGVLKVSRPGVTALERLGPKPEGDPK